MKTNGFEKLSNSHTSRVLMQKLETKSHLEWLMENNMKSQQKATKYLIWDSTQWINSEQYEIDGDLLNGFEAEECETNGFGMINEHQNHNKWN